MIAFFIVVYVIISVLAVRAAYYNGVTDGYGACMEPGNPGYRKAFNYLKKYASHRWYIKDEVKNDD